MRVANELSVDIRLPSKTHANVSRRCVNKLQLVIHDYVLVSRDRPGSIGLSTPPNLPRTAVVEQEAGNTL
jgi:hypothetical protein